MDREAFFNNVRSSPFGGSLFQRQVDGCNAILDAWENSDLTDDRWLAYMLATTYHETAQTMQPIKEYGNEAYFKRMYDIEGDRPAKAKELGNVNPGDGAKYCGRGYVQLTGRTNYTDMSKRIGVDLVGNPDLALDPSHASFIMFEGMTLGTFTGKKLSDYLSGSKTDYVNARRIINALDKADTIAKYAEDFERAIAASRVEPEPEPEPKPPAPEPVLGFDWRPFIIEQLRLVADNLEATMKDDPG